MELLSIISSCRDGDKERNRKYCVQHDLVLPNLPNFKKVEELLTCLDLNEKKVLKFSNLLTIIECSMINLFHITNFKKIEESLVFGTNLGLKE